MAFLYEERLRHLGLARGSLWLVVSSSAFAAWALLTTRLVLATALLGAMFVVAVGLSFRGIALIRAVRALPRGTAAPASVRKSIMRRFLGVIVVEILGWMTVNLICIATRHWLFIVPLNLMIVGLHFLPLARLFHVPRYNLLGLFFCVIPLLTMLAIPASTHVGHALSWFVIPSVGCTLAAYVIAGAGLREVGRFVSVSQVKA